MAGTTTKTHLSYNTDGYQLDFKIMGREVYDSQVRGELKAMIQRLSETKLVNMYDTCYP